MDLYIIRHAIAVDPGTPGFEDDSQRPLSERGRERLEKIAQGLKVLGADFDLIISSPFLRSMDTAEILLRFFKMKKDQLLVSEALIPQGQPEQLIGEINENYSSLNSIIVVGHEPNLSQLISLLTAGDAAISIDMKQGSVCRLNADNLAHERRATLEWLMMPKHLVALGESR